MTKTLLPIFLGFVAILSPLRADDITLTDGTVLKNAKIVQEDNSTKTVTISFSGGIAQVHSAMVPATLASAQPPAVTNAANLSTPLPKPPTPSSPSTPIPKDWTVNGKDYHNVIVGQVDADRVHITYDGGLGTVMLSDLPPDLQKRFNYDPVAAKQTTQERAQQASQADAELAAEMRQNAKAGAAQDKNAAQADVSSDKARVETEANAHLKALFDEATQKRRIANSHEGRHGGEKEAFEAERREHDYALWMTAHGIAIHGTSLQ